MRLIVAHQILIAAAIALAAIFAVRSGYLYGQSGGPTDLVLAILSVAIGAVLTWYLRKVRATAARAKQRIDAKGPHA